MEAVTVVDDWEMGADLVTEAVTVVDDWEMGAVYHVCVVRVD